MDGRITDFWFTVFSFATLVSLSKEQYQGCLELPLVGKERNLSIPDSSYTASSYFNEKSGDDRYKPSNAKLNGSNGWAAEYNNNPHDYLQIDLGTPRVITAIETQGNGYYGEWVKTYKINSTDNITKWTSYKENNLIKIFKGNKDRRSVVRHKLTKPIKARYIRFIPITYKEHKTMRINVYVASRQLQAPPSLTVTSQSKSILIKWTIQPCLTKNPITKFWIKVGSYPPRVQNQSNRSYTWTKLRPYTEYSVSVKVETQNGSGAWSEVKNIKTSIAAPEATPDLVTAHAVLPVSIHLGWKLIQPESINGPFKGYRITYTSQCGKTKTIDVGNITTYNLTSLHKYTNYSITIAVRNTKYIGSPSTERRVRTLEDAPSAPRNARYTLSPAHGLKRPQIMIMWDRPLYLNGIIRRYTIIYFYAKGAPRTINLTNIAGGMTNSRHYNITIMSGGIFSYKIRARTIKEGPFTAVETLNVPEYQCPERSLIGENHLAIPRTHYTATSQYDKRYAPFNATLYGPFGWPPKEKDNPADYLQIDLGTPRVISAVATQGSGITKNNEWVTKYKLFYKSQQASKPEGGFEFQGNQDSSTVVRHDLEHPITARYIRFVPTSYHGNKTMRVNVYVSYQETPSIKVVDVSKISFRLSWSIKPCSPTHLIKGYTVKVVDKKGTPGERNVSGVLEHDVSYLKPYTEYNVSVRAIKEVGYGGWSNVTTITTAMAEPEAIPVITKVEANVLQSITIEWKLEKAHLIHGPFKGYLIRYSTQGHTKEMFVDCKVVTACTTYTLTSLVKYTTYSVNIAVVNERYSSPPSGSKSIRTKIDEPDASPTITSIESHSSQSITLKWRKVDSDEINGNFQAYRIKYTAEGGEANTLDVGDVTTHTLTSLLKYTMYSVNMAVMNENFVGPESPAVKTRTLEDAPSAPMNVNGSLLPTNGSIPPRVVITWDKPRHPNGIIRKYTIVYYYSMDTSNTKTVNIKGTNDLQYTMNFTNNGVLSFKISATTIKEGPYQSGKVAPLDHKGTTQRNSDTPGGSATDGLAAGLVVGILLILLFLILAFLIWKRKRTHKERYDRAGSLPLASVDYSPSSATYSATDNINFVNANTETTQALAPSLLSTEIERHRSSRMSSRSASFKRAKPPVDFPAPDINKLKKEFKSVPVELRFLDCKEGSKSANKAKNRYKNIIAYDHSLVSLEWVYGETESFYINANFIHGYDGSPEVYIATQGPLNITVNDFWRMIWEQKVSSIVMLTKLRELGKVKCYQYWPDDCHQYSDITITNHKTEVFADFTIRTFFMSKAGSQNRRVRQFHFTAWPDKGVPDHATAVLSFRRKVLTMTSGNDDSPTVVHCSAGVGRTGTYIMIDAMLRQAEDQRHVDIFTYLKTIRNDRPYMVQTVEQYIFVNMAIYDALACGNTEVPVQNLVYALQQLSIVDRRHKMTGYAQEFQRLDDVTTEDTQSGNFDVGFSRKNVKKNRYPDILAANANRVILSTVDDTEIGDYINYSVIAAFKERKGDYINASFVDTYREHNAFILTQAPMENTIVDFWRMIIDYKIGSIVMLNNLEEQCEMFPQYWPLHGTKTYESIWVRLVETKHLPGNILLRILEVSNRRKQFTVNHFQHLTWENKGVPTNPQSVLRLLHEVQKSQQKSGNSPIVVQCNNGVGRSGTFCAIASCLERVKQEQVLDVFQTIKSIRVNRPGAVETLPQYVFCYTIIQKYLDSFRDYANFGDI